MGLLAAIRQRSTSWASNSRLGKGRSAIRRPIIGIFWNSAAWIKEVKRSLVNKVSGSLRNSAFDNVAIEWTVASGAIVSPYTKTFLKHSLISGSLPVNRNTPSVCIPVASYVCSVCLSIGCVLLVTKIYAEYSNIYSIHMYTTYTQKKRYIQQIQNIYAKYQAAAGPSGPARPGGAGPGPARAGRAGRPRRRLSFCIYVCTFL